MNKVLKWIEEISKGRFLTKYVFHYDVDGEEFPYEVVSRNTLEYPDDVTSTKANAVEIIAKFDDGDFLICKEFRYAVNDFVYEFPAGLIDEGETPVEAAIRELKEETGLDVLSVERVLPKAYSSAGMTDESLQTVFVTVTGTIKGSDNPKEEIYSYKVSVDDIAKLLEDKDAHFSHRCQLVCNSIAHPLV